MCLRVATQIPKKLESIFFVTFTTLPVYFFLQTLEAFKLRSSPSPKKCQENSETLHPNCFFKDFRAL